MKVTSTLAYYSRVLKNGRKSIIASANMKKWKTKLTMEQSILDTNAGKQLF